MKTFNLKEYIPIDYPGWVLGNEARSGVNINGLGVLTQKELELWNYSAHYQDQRKDPEEWKKLVELNKGNLKVLDSEELRRPHQNRGIMVAGRGFKQIGYPSEEYHFEIADII